MPHMHRLCTVCASGASLAAKHASLRREAHLNEARRAWLHQIRAAASTSRRTAAAPIAAP
jgi:hypothetical protein